jgi:hypothetical protein
VVASGWRAPAPCSALVRPAAAHVLTGERAACDLSYQDIPVVVGGRHLVADAQR